MGSLKVCYLYWCEFRKCWVDSKATEGLPLSKEQVKDILTYFGLLPQLKYFSAEELLTTPPEKLQQEQERSAAFSWSGGDDDDSIYYIFWNYREQVWMADVDPREDDDYEPNPRPMSQSFQEDLMEKICRRDLSRYHYDAKVFELILHMPPEELREFQYNP